MSEPEILDRCSPIADDCLHCVVSRYIAAWMYKHPDFNKFVALADMSQVLAEMVAGMISPQTRTTFLVDLYARIKDLVAQMDDDDEHKESAAIVRTFVDSKKPKKAH